MRAPTVPGKASSAGLTSIAAWRDGVLRLAAPAFALSFGALSAAAVEPLRQYLNERAEAAKVQKALLEKLIEKAKENGKEK